MLKKSNYTFLFGLPVIVLLAVTILVLISPSYDDIAVAEKPANKQNNGKSENHDGSPPDEQPADPGDQPVDDPASSIDDGNPIGNEISDKNENPINASDGGNHDGIRGNSPSVPDSDTHGMNRGLPGPDKSHDQDNGCGNELGLKEDDNNGWCGNKPTKTPPPTEPPPSPTPPTPTETPPPPPTPPPPTETPPPPPTETPPPPVPDIFVPDVSEEKPPEPCIPKEVIVAKEASTITVFVLENLVPTLEYYLDLPIAGSSNNDIISVSPDGCWVYYSWQKAGDDQTDIYRISIDGKRIIQVTRTEDVSESEPFVARNWYLYMTSATGSQTQVEGMIESSSKRWVVVADGKLPAASPDSQQITYQDISNGEIAAAMCDGDARDFSSYAVPGSWNAWRPDGSGLLFQDQATFYALPFSGSEATFVEKSISAALRPAGGYGAVLTDSGDLSMYPLKDWLIAGEAREIKPLIQAGFITWWSPGRMQVAAAPR